MMAQLKLYSLEEMKDKSLGLKGTPIRDAYESELQEELQAYHIGEAIKQARKAKDLTQEQLGNLMGVRKAQISRIESGKNINLSTVARVFKALGIPAKLQVGNLSLSLW